MKYQLFSILLISLSTWAQLDAQHLQEIFRKAESGDPGSQYSLGIAYHLGDGVEKDAIEAAKWYLRAASQGHSNAQYMLGLSYNAGVGVPKNPAEARRWYLLAAEQGHQGAKSFLSVSPDSGISSVLGRSIEHIQNPHAVQSSTVQSNLLIDSNLRNGGFEIAGTSTTAPFADWQVIPAESLAISPDTEAPFEGKSACRMVVDDEGTYIAIFPAANPDFFVSGKRYRLSFWARSAGSGGLQISSPNSGVLFATGALTTNYRRFETEYRSDGRNIAIGRQYGISNGATLWIDNVELILIAD